MLWTCGSDTGARARSSTGMGAQRGLCVPMSRSRPNSSASHSGIGHALRSTEIHCFWVATAGASATTHVHNELAFYYLRECKSTSVCCIVAEYLSGACGTDGLRMFCGLFWASSAANYLTNPVCYVMLADGADDFLILGTRNLHKPVARYRRQCVRTRAYKGIARTIRIIRNMPIVD